MCIRDRTALVAADRPHGARNRNLLRPSSLGVGHPLLHSPARQRIARICPPPRRPRLRRTHARQHRKRPVRTGVREQLGTPAAAAIPPAVSGLRVQLRAASRDGRTIKKRRTSGPDKTTGVTFSVRNSRRFQRRPVTVPNRNSACTWASCQGRAAEWAAARDGP